MQRYMVRGIGENRGKPRVYLELAGLAHAGFTPGRTYVREVNVDARRVTLTLQPNGSHVVSGKQRPNGDSVAVIDINSAEALKPFEGMQAVRVVIDDRRIHILPLASEARRIDRETRLARELADGEITTAGAAFGGGVLDHAAHAGLRDAGVAARLALANEIDDGLLDHAREHNDVSTDQTTLIAAPMQEAVQDEWLMRKLKSASLFVCGIPCSGASVGGRAKRGLAVPEQHPEVGHLVASAIMLIQRLNPAVAVVECVTPYSTSGSAHILRHHLRDCGYNCVDVQLDAEEFGCLEQRVRWFLVATSRGVEVDLAALTPALRAVPNLRDVLDDVPLDAPDWRSFSYLIEKEQRDAAKGNSFAMQVLSADANRVPVLRKGYQKGGSSDPLLAHPTDPSLMRQFTVAEHARIKGVPEHLVHGLGKTEGHALLGQGVAYAPVRALFRRIGECLRSWHESATQGLASAPIGYSLQRATG